MKISSKPELHLKLLEAADKEAIGHGSVNDVPFSINLATLGSINFYAFTIVSSHREQPEDHCKVQLFVPGQRKGERGQLSLADEAFTIISGYQPDEDVFVFWDAYAHLSFSYLQSLRVKKNYVWLAQIYGTGTCKHRLREGKGMEIVVACRADHFMEGVRARMKYSAQRTNLRAGSLWEDTL